MGVPAFYRWLVNKYPNTVVKAIPETQGENNDASNRYDDDVASGDTTPSPNPNGEFDNLYLDMNGIIHPCFHPNDDHIVPPTTFQEVFQSIFEYIDRLFLVVRPRKLLYMAIDGVAPRAKMNQQRARRFRAAKDAEIAENEENDLRRKFKMEGKQVLPNVESEVADSNVITPGTKFLYELSKALQIYIRNRLKNDAGWKKVKVILSDANVPGEGEHKIMSFIRLQRLCPNYDPNMRHCLHGLDADLIMLALATHEVHFSILREDVIKQEQQLSCQSSQVHENSNLIKQPYEFLNIWILREYLQLDMEIVDLPEDMKNLDFERIVDDFIFLCFFSGNDFLPHMPTLDIHEGAIDLLMTVYKKEFKNLGGHLVDMQRAKEKNAAYLKLSRVEKFILVVGTYEEQIFKKRSEVLERRRRRILNEHLDAREQEDSGTNDVDIEISAVENNISMSGTTDWIDSSDEVLRNNTKELKKLVRESIRNETDLFKNDSLCLDKVRLGYHGWKERYYKYKFSAETQQDIINTRKSIVRCYTEGLCWVLLYYFSGVPSWTWFYPYHYGPFASDMKGLAHVKVKFQEGSPFRPFDQLMGVLPPRSAHALPKSYQPLMTDDTSNIIDFYPPDFEVDSSGKRFLWQGICKLPFIDENRLLSETRKAEKEIELSETFRNAVGHDRLFLLGTSEFGKYILTVYKRKECENQQPNALIEIDNSLRDGIAGFIDLFHKDSEICDQISPNDIQVDDVLCIFYQLPLARPHIPRPLCGVKFDERTIFPRDIKETQLWHECHGSQPRSYQESSRNAISSHNWKSTKGATGSHRKSNSTSCSDVPILPSSSSGWRGRSDVNTGWSRGRANPSPFYEPSGGNSVHFNPTGRARPDYGAAGLGRAGTGSSFGRASPQAPDNTRFHNLKISGPSRGPMPPESLHPTPVGCSSYQRPRNSMAHNSNCVGQQKNPYPDPRPTGRFQSAPRATSLLYPGSGVVYSNDNVWQRGPWRPSAVNSQMHHAYASAAQAYGNRPPSPSAPSLPNRPWSRAGNSQPNHSYASAVQARGSTQHASRNPSPRGSSRGWFPNTAETAGR